MKRKAKKRTLVIKRRALKVYERLSFDLTTRLELTNTWNAESFLASDMTYRDWLSYFTPSVGNKFEDFVYVPHQGSFCMETKIKPASLEQQQQELLGQAYESLDLFRETRVQQHLHDYIRLFAQYKELLQRANQKFRKIIGRIKSRLRGRMAMDNRTQIRRFSRLSVRNTDDEEHVNELSIFLIIRTFILTMYNHVNSRYNRYHRQPGVLFSGHQ